MNSPQLQPATRWIGASVQTLLAARGQPARLGRLFARSSVPMLMVDGERRYVEANVPARLSFRQTLADLRRLRIDDLTPRYFWPEMEKAWSRLMEAGCVAGRYDLVSPANTRLEVYYYAIAGALPGLHLAAFAPFGWPEEELLCGAVRPAAAPQLTPRELEVLEYTADGHTNTMIAQALVIQPSTVKSHLANIYDKLAVRDRAAAVASAMRLGLIA